MLKVWLRRFAYLTVIALWLLVMSFPILAFLLAVRGEVQFGSDVRRNMRLFLVQEQDDQGIGLQLTSPLDDTEHCSQTNLSYFLWEGDSSGQNTTYCTCYDLSRDPPAPLSCDLLNGE